MDGAAVGAQPQAAICTCGGRVNEVFGRRRGQQGDSPLTGAEKLSAANAEPEGALGVAPEIRDRRVQGGPLMGQRLPLAFRRPMKNAAAARGHPKPAGFIFQQGFAGGTFGTLRPRVGSGRFAPDAVAIAKQALPQHPAADGSRNPNSAAAGRGDGGHRFRRGQGLVGRDEGGPRPDGEFPLGHGPDPALRIA